MNKVVKVVVEVVSLYPVYCWLSSNPATVLELTVIRLVIKKIEINIKKLKKHKKYVKQNKVLHKKKLSLLKSTKKTSI